MLNALLLAFLLVAPLAAAAPALTVDPPRASAEPGTSLRVRLTASGSDPDGGVYDVLWQGDGLVVRFEQGAPPQGIPALPGRPISGSWIVILDVPQDAETRVHEVDLRFVERPSPGQTPASANAIAAVDVAASALGPGPSTMDAIIPNAPAEEEEERPDAAVLLGLSALLVLVLAVAKLRQSAAFLIGTLYWRYRRDQLLEHPIRAAIVARVAEEPGITPATLQRVLGLSDGQLDHHLRRLVVAGFVVKVRRDGSRLLYPSGTRIESTTDLARRIEEALSREKGMTAREIAEIAGTSPQLARYYLSQFESDGRARSVLVGRNRQYRRSG